MSEKPKVGDAQHPYELGIDVRVALSLPRGATDADVMAAIQKLKTHDGYVTLNEHRKVQAELKAIKQAEARRTADAIVDKFVGTGQLDPNNRRQMDWARAHALSQPEAFDALMTDAPVVALPNGKGDVETSKGQDVEPG